MARHPLGVSSFLLASPFSDDDDAEYDRVAAWGFDVIEACVEDPGVLHADSIAEAATRNGLAVSICGVYGSDRDASSDDPAIRANYLAYQRHCIDLAQAVGSPHVAGPMYSAVGKARMLAPEERRAERRRAAESIRAAADYAGERGVRLAIEPLNRFENDMINIVDQGLELIELVDRPNVGLMLDTFHMNIEEQDPGDAIRRAGERTFHVQVSENHRGTPGTGSIDWPRIWQALDDIGYDGSVVIESFLPEVVEIAKAVSLWRPWAPSAESLITGGLAFLKAQLR
ncbi:MAG: sugar phosphate isomerase [Micrococcales bacterium 73-13]|nr:MAG: sugar phosphate isomerase [Micrococcales bacterium 73-13]